MAIDIRNVSSGKIASSRTSTKKTSATSASDDSGSTEAADDSIELTGKAAQIQALIKQMMASPAVDRSRVDPVKEKIQEGRYEIETKRVANKMLDFEVSYSRVR